MKRFVAALAAAALVALAHNPALAATDLTFSPMKCLSGSFDRTDPSDDYLQLTGHLDCAGSGSGFTFGVAHYYDGGSGQAEMFDSTLRRYGNEAPSAFSVGNEVDFGPRRFGLCLVTDYDVRVACVRVTVEKNMTLSVVTPLATDDPLVNRPVTGVYLDLPGGPRPRVPGGPVPSCGGCW